VPKYVYLCFIDYSKAFDSVECLKMWNSIRSMGIPQHLTLLIRVPYTKHEAKKQVEQGTIEGAKARLHPISWSVAYTQQVQYKNSMVRRHASRCQNRGIKNKQPKICK
jgi:hypothetical protein